MKALDLVRNWPAPAAGFVVALRLRTQPTPYRALGLRVR
jgi:hypothetical protein